MPSATVEQPAPYAGPAVAATPVAPLSYVSNIARFLASFPIAFFVGTLVTDVVYAQTADMLWANFSAWMLAAGLVMGTIAAIAAALTRRKVRVAGDALFWAGCALIALLSAVNLLVHSRDAYTSVVPSGLALSAVVTVLVVAVSWQRARRLNTLMIGRP